MICNVRIGRVAAQLIIERVPEPEPEPETRTIHATELLGTAQVFASNVAQHPSCTDGQRAAAQRAALAIAELSAQFEG